MEHRFSSHAGGRQGAGPARQPGGQQPTSAIGRANAQPAANALQNTLTRSNASFLSHQSSNDNIAMSQSLTHDQSPINRRAAESGASFYSNAASPANKGKGSRPETWQHTPQIGSATQADSLYTSHQSLSGTNQGGGGSPYTNYGPGALQPGRAHSAYPDQGPNAMQVGRGNMPQSTNPSPAMGQARDAQAVRFQSSGPNPNTRGTATPFTTNPSQWKDPDGKNSGNVGGRTTSVMSSASTMYQTLNTKHGRDQTQDVFSKSAAVNYKEHENDDCFVCVGDSQQTLFDSRQLSPDQNQYKGYNSRGQNMMASIDPYDPRSTRARPTPVITTEWVTWNQEVVASFFRQNKDYFDKLDWFPIVRSMRQDWVAVVYQDQAQRIYRQMCYLDRDDRQWHWGGPVLVKERGRQPFFAFDPQTAFHFKVCKVNEGLQEAIWYNIWRQFDNVDESNIELNGRVTGRGRDPTVSLIHKSREDEGDVTWLTSEFLTVYTDSDPKGERDILHYNLFSVALKEDSKANAWLSDAKRGDLITVNSLTAGKASYAQKAHQGAKAEISKAENPIQIELTDQKMSIILYTDRDCKIAYTYARRGGVPSTAAPSPAVNETSKSQTQANLLDSSFKTPKQDSFAQTVRTKMDTPDCPETRCPDPALMTMDRGGDARATPEDKDLNARDPLPGPRRRDVEVNLTFSQPQRLCGGDRQEIDGRILYASPCSKNMFVLALASRGFDYVTSCLLRAHPQEQSLTVTSMRQDRQLGINPREEDRFTRRCQERQLKELYQDSTRAQLLAILQGYPILPDEVPDPDGGHDGGADEEEAAAQAQAEEEEDDRERLCAVCWKKCHGRCQGAQRAAEAEREKEAADERKEKATKYPSGTHAASGITHYSQKVPHKGSQTQQKAEEGLQQRARKGGKEDRDPRYHYRGKDGRPDDGGPEQSDDRADASSDSSGDYNSYLAQQRENLCTTCWSKCGGRCQRLAAEEARKRQQQMQDYNNQRDDYYDSNERYDAGRDEQERFKAQYFGERQGDDVNNYQHYQQRQHAEQQYSNQQSNIHGADYQYQPNYQQQHQYDQNYSREQQKNTYGGTSYDNTNSYSSNNYDNYGQQKSQGSSAKDQYGLSKQTDSNKQQKGANRQGDVLDATYWAQQRLQGTGQQQQADRDGSQYGQRDSYKSDTRQKQTSGSSAVGWSNQKTQPASHKAQTDAYQKYGQQNSQYNYGAQERQQDSYGSGYGASGRGSGQADPLSAAYAAHSATGGHGSQNPGVGLPDQAYQDPADTQYAQYGPEARYTGGYQYTQSQKQSVANVAGASQYAKQRLAEEKWTEQQNVQAADPAYQQEYYNQQYTAGFRTRQEKEDDLYTQQSRALDRQYKGPEYDQNQANARTYGGRTAQGAKQVTFYDGKDPSQYSQYDHETSKIDRGYAQKINQNYAEVAYEQQQEEYLQQQSQSRRSTISGTAGGYGSTSQAANQAQSRKSILTKKTPQQSPPLYNSSNQYSANQFGANLGSGQASSIQQQSKKSVSFKDSAVTRDNYGGQFKHGGTSSQKHWAIESATESGGSGSGPTDDEQQFLQAQRIGMRFNK